MRDLVLQLILVIVIGYLLGSIPTAYLIGQARNVDIFAVGSGNMGATNVVRSMGVFWGVVTWFFDSLKGAAAMLIAAQIVPDHRVTASIAAAIAAIAGHNWSFFATIITGTLRGGKGAAVTFGTLLLIVPFHIIAIMLCICGVIIALTRYMSLGVLLMFTFGMGWIILRASQGAMPWEYTLYAVIAQLLILVRFQGNIKRLLNGTERRMFERAG